MFLARPLLALKRDFSRPSSSVRQSSEQNSTDERVGSDHDSSTVDIETNGSLKMIFEKVKTTLSSSSSPPPIRSDEKNKSLSSESQRLSISSDSSQDPRNNKLRQQKSVSFVENDLHRRRRSSDRIHQQLSDPNTTNDDVKIDVNVNEFTCSTQNGDEDDFRRQFYQSIKPRRISIGNCRDLVYQDLSAEIVAYVLKHALRSLEEEDEQLQFLAWEQTHSNEKQSTDVNVDVEEDFIDLK